MKGIFDEFVGREVKAPYRDGHVLKVARGILKEEDDLFIKIQGTIGTIIINKADITKMSLR